MRLVFAGFILILTGCADLSYYLHSINGHLDVVSRSRSIEDVLADQDTAPELRAQLKLVQRVRIFAFENLQLPESDSYTEFADLERDYVLKSLFATEEFSISAHQWCYPVVGCAGYRGYFDEARLQRYVDELEARNFDVYVANVPAYSTLGWFDDPVLNTFINWPEYRLAGLIFHELSHQRLYIDGDTTFNESFAMAVQQAGVERWLLDTGQTEKLAAYQRHVASREQVLNFIQNERDKLAQLYRQPMAAQEKREAKAAFLHSMLAGYRALSASFEGSDGFGKWFEAGLNNAKLVSVSTYHARTPAFARLLEHHAGDFKAFYAHVERIGALEPGPRSECLDYWQSAPDDLPREGMKMGGCIID
jgi:predicted aminopeptidase